MSRRFVTMEVNGHQNGLVNILQNTTFLFHRRFLFFWVTCHFILEADAADDMCGTVLWFIYTLSLKNKLN